MSSRCAIYARYSSEKQNPLSPDQQIRKCREYADRNGLDVLDDFIFADEAISGASDDRTALQRLLSLAKHRPRQFDVILVDDTSRLSRKLVDALRIFEQLQFVGVRVVFVAQGIDTNSEQAELLVATHGIVDSLYLKDLAKRTFRGVEQRALEGLHTGGRVFGYRHIPIEKSGMLDAHGRTVVDGVRLEVEPAHADTVRRIFERYAAGHSMKRIAIDMNTEGIQSPQPQKGRISRSWCQSSIHHILHNERYRGLVIWGKTYKLRSADTGKRIYRRKPASEWRRKELPAQRIVSDKLWEAAQNRMRFVHDLYGTGAKNGIRAGRAAGSPYLFTGLLKCALCGGAVTIVSGTKRSRQDSRYGCSMHAYRGSQVCGNKLLIPRRVLEAQLLAGLQANVLRPEVIDYTLRRFEEELTKIARGEELAKARTGDAKALEAKKAKIEEGIANCTNAIAEGQPSRFLIAKLSELERDLEAVFASLRGAQPNAVRCQLKDTRRFVEVRLKDLQKLLNAEPRIVRAAIGKHVQKITMTPDGRTYIASGSWDLLGAGAGAVSMVPGARIELATPAFSGRRSTTELPRHVI
jgi:site-specific DNA recombinase